MQKLMILFFNCQQGQFLNKLSKRSPLQRTEDSPEPLVRDGFKNPPYCEDIIECLEITPPPCNFPVCVDGDPHLDGSPEGKYHCKCKAKERWADGPNPNEFGRTSCVEPQPVAQCPNEWKDFVAGNAFCESTASVDKTCSYYEDCWYVCRISPFCLILNFSPVIC